MIKDWKLHSKKSGGRWENETIFINKNNGKKLYIDYSDAFGSKGWDVTIGVGHTWFYQGAKTKAQAMKFAKDYMRTH